MGIIISVKDTRVDRIFTHPVTNKKYQKTFNFQAGVALKTENEVEEEYGKALAKTNPDTFFTSKESYEEYLKALEEEPDQEAEMETFEAETEESSAIPSKEELSVMTMPELKAIASDLGLQFAGNISKVALVDLISQEIDQAPKEG